MVCYLFCLFALVALCGVINVGTDQLLTLSQLAKRLPRHRNDRPVHPSTCHRWRSPGVRGVRLECVRIGGIWHTSWESFQRFCDLLTSVAQGSSPAAPRPPANASQDSDYQDQVEQALRDKKA